MKNHWTSFFAGYTKVKISGRLIEPLLNQCAKSGVQMWELRRLSEDSCEMYVYLKHIKELRHIVRHYRCKMRFTEKKGLPFWSIRMLHNSGFVIGILGALMIMFLLSNMVWDIEIEGAEPDTEHKLRQAIDEYGVKRGKPLFLLPDAAIIQQDLTIGVDGITWLGVERTGTTYHFQVVEEKRVTPDEVKGPQHLVAKKQAVIHDLFIEEGQPLVTVNDYVEKGDILVSGILGKEGQTKMASAKGEVLGEVWYQSTVYIPMKTKFNVLTGEKVTKRYMNVSGISIPIWGFGDVPYEQFEQNEKQTPLLFFKWTTPITYEESSYLEKKVVQRNYDKKSAIEQGKKIGKKELFNRIDQDATIKGEKVLHQSVENGKVKLIIHYQVIENISVEQPIIQGD
ncbi:sporulation protein YqfD [Bacillus solimangrovi]|uniref:Sporulation protein YqfD n=1 Tax=Bacillus solimangrovi TaxID=1305675 RepID=A0A1E5LHY3_9BACI|nr:sporulation protein YqfD [Bacillus solimangrovi]OEH93699.1 sporulation protein YqfD [Bacillus solimangrovi]